MQINKKCLLTKRLNVLDDLVELEVGSFQDAEGDPLGRGQVAEAKHHLTKFLQKVGTIRF